ncbi:helix-turn-helix domain-containing protein [Clostridium sp. HCP1S3_C6]
MKAKFGKYDDELAHKFGYLDFKLERKNKIKIQKQITNNVRDISDTAFKIYLALMNYKSLNPKITNFTAENICEIASISSRTFYRNILDLVTNGIFIKKAKIDKKKREKYSYYINPYISDYGGFTLLERATIKIMLQELNDPEIKLYTVMCSMLYKKSNVWAGQNFIRYFL